MQSICYYGYAIKCPAKYRLKRMAKFKWKLLSYFTLYNIYKELNGSEIKTCQEVFLRHFFFFFWINKILDL